MSTLYVYLRLKKYWKVALIIRIFKIPLIIDLIIDLIQTNAISN